MTTFLVGRNNNHVSKVRQTESTKRARTSIPKGVMGMNFVIGMDPGGTSKKVGLRVRPASQNSYPIYDQNLRYSQPHL